MTLVQCDIEEIEKVRKSIIKNEAIGTIERFANSDMVCARVEDYHYVDAGSCYATLHRAIQRGRYYNIKAVRLNNKVYLIKKDAT